MLVLSRQRDESIMIGDDVEIRVVDIRGEKVRLGISAPRSLSVHRKEVYEAIRRENQSAAQVMPGDVPVVPPVQSDSKTPVAATRPPSADEHTRFLAAAIEQARKSLNEGGLPIGAVLVRAGKIIGRGHNRRVQDGDPMAHAEIDCLKNAGRQTSYRDTTLYSTLMPCFLCAGAILQFRIPRVVVGESVNFPGGCGPAGTSINLLKSAGVDVLDLHNEQCIQLMRDFIQAHPELWNEDIGQEPRPKPGSNPSSG